MAACARFGIGVVALTLAFLVGAAGAGESSGETLPDASGRLAGPLTVLAAASLTGSFRAVAAEFEVTRPAVEVQLSFAGSPTLVHQIEHGAVADVLALADEPTMLRVVERGETLGAPRIFAQNALAIAVAAGNPKGIAGLADLAKPGLVVALCGETVPAGRYARAAFARAGVAVPEGSREIDVKAVLGKVLLGEADGGVVYVTDVFDRASGVDVVPIPEQHNVVARYPIATLREAPNPAAAAAFVDFVLSPPGQAVLARFGFRGP